MTLSYAKTWLPARSRRSAGLYTPIAFWLKLRRFWTDWRVGACCSKPELHRGFELVSGEMLPDGRLGACCVTELTPHHLNTE